MKQLQEAGVSIQAVAASATEPILFPTMPLVKGVDDKTLAKIVDEIGMYERFRRLQIEWIRKRLPFDPNDVTTEVVDLIDNHYSHLQFDQLLQARSMEFMW